MTIEVRIAKRTHDMHTSKILCMDEPYFGTNGVFLKEQDKVTRHFFPYRNILQVTWEEV